MRPDHPVEWIPKITGKTDVDVSSPAVLLAEIAQSKVRAQQFPADRNLDHLDQIGRRPWADDDQSIGPTTTTELCYTMPWNKHSRVGRQPMAIRSVSTLTTASETL
jgi:hypothetical protein